MKNLNLEVLFLEALKKIVKGDPKSKSYLIGISGGSDSMCLASLFLNCGLKFCLAHVNYSLRGADSINDMNFVTTWADENKVLCFTKIIDTPLILASQGGNMQQLARNIRYSFFEETRLENNIDFVCTAHHASDWLETIIFNFFRGGLLNALVGMPARNDAVLRPLLYVEKSFISDYLTQNEIPFRTDGSNEKLIYNRNLIRHNILPLLKFINPSLLSTFISNNKIWIEMINIKNDFIERESQKIITRITENEFLIDLDHLNNSKAPITFIHEILSPLGFTSNMMLEMDQRRHKSVSIGTVFYHNDWKIIKLEHTFRVVKFNFNKTELNSLEIFSLGAYSFSNNKEIIIDSLKTKPKKLNHGKDIILVDAEKIVFPLILRKWSPGDFFHPINMNNHTKKVQDFLTDIKIDKINKNEIFVLLNANGQIIWVVGLRQDNRFKIEPNTEHILIFEIKIK